MTIKYVQKNISAENITTLFDIEVQRDSNNQINHIILTRKNFYEGEADTSHDLLDYFYTKQQVDERIKIHMVVYNDYESLPETSSHISDGKENYIYLVPLTEGTQGGIYKEYIWAQITDSSKYRTGESHHNDFVENGNHYNYESMGSTDIDLQPILSAITDLQNDKLNKSDVENSLTYSTNNALKALSAYQGYILNRDKVNTADISDIATSGDYFDLDKFPICKPTVLAPTISNDNVIIELDENEDDIIDDRLYLIQVSSSVEAYDSSNLKIKIDTSNYNVENIIGNSIKYNTIKGAGYILAYFTGTAFILISPNINYLDTKIDAELYNYVSSSSLSTTLLNYLAKSDLVGSFTDLQTLITNASSGDTIVLDKDYKHTGSEAKINITKPLTIVGNGHIIDGDSYGVGILEITSEGNGTILDNIIFMNAHKTNNLGGAVYCRSNNIINKCIFLNNINESVQQRNKGGAIACEGNNIITECVFIKNKAGASGGTGGAIYSGDSTLSNIIKNCEFFKNTMTASASAGGAGIHSSSATLKVYDCTFDATSTLYNTENVSYLTDGHIVDNVTTNDATKVLSAKQGKVLQDNIDGKADWLHTNHTVINNFTIEDLTDTSAASFEAKCAEIDITPAPQLYYFVRNTAGTRYLVYGYDNLNQVWTLLSDSNPPSSNVTVSSITDATTVPVVVTYTDDTTEVINLLKYVPPSP